jgi:predicted HAD superfamily Cof-like phosphohydrolase
VKHSLEQVMRFNHEILGIEPRILGPMQPDEADHLVRCLDEETSEFTAAFVNHDFIGQIDSIMDLMYFAMGGLYKMGLSAETAEQIFSAIHDANMTKKKGVVARRDNGSPDAIKPEGWRSPEERIAEILDGA